MIGFVIWIIGLVLTIKAALEIWRIHAPAERRLIAIILVVLTSWDCCSITFMVSLVWHSGWAPVLKGIDGHIAVYAE